MIEVLNVQQIVLQHLILLCILKSFNLLPVRMINEALRLVEFHINMIYDQHSTHLETCAYIVVITFLHAHVVDKLTSTVHDIV